MSEEAMDAGIEVKVEPYDGTYECLFCGESVRGQAALQCWQCNSNPFHRARDPQSKYAEVCPTCGRQEDSRGVDGRKRRDCGAGRDD